MIPIMKQVIVFCLLTVAGVTLATLSDHSCPENEVFRPTGGPRCENCGPRCLVFDTTAKCYCKSGYSRVNGNCIPNKECPPRKTARTAMENPELYDGDRLGVAVDEDRSAVPTDDKLWPNGVIPYVFHSNLTGAQWNATIWGMAHIQEKTCIKFVPRTTEKNYVMMYHGEGCSAHWGRIGGMQLLSMGDNCEFIGTAMHELMHAIGFDHEHKRPDRDNYVNIHWENIQPSMNFAFRKYSEAEVRSLTRFDFDSVMLYGSYTFPRDWNLVTMTKKDGSLIMPTYDKLVLSPIDILRVKMLYHC